ncbi:unnamed protein product [Brugia timori]|uniref:Ovule protein n=1 Tax=Brugia timori TaxID=42155 RepID=A0A0R3QEW1_9BILA|nr:unnamed protein product [Brugia timori]
MHELDNDSCSNLIMAKGILMHYWGLISNRIASFFLSKILITIAVSTMGLFSVRLSLSMKCVYITQ